MIEYSGYGYADPAGPQRGISILANLMGFTVVDVNMRGTGCSGGAYDLFEPLQSLDRYDVVEAIARQPWVLHNKVGMMGISYGGISQLFTGQTNPPSLAAISPLSVLDSTQTTLYPGGILNTGFAVAWAQERVHDAQAASTTGGQPWAYQRIQEGDATCSVLPDRPAQRQHHGRRRRRRAPLGPLLHPECRSSGDDQRGQARRQGDLRAERLAASQRAQARRRQEHAAIRGRL